MKKIYTILASLALGFSLCSCAISDQAGQSLLNQEIFDDLTSSGQKTVSFALDKEALTFNSSTLFSPLSLQIQPAVIEGLITYDQDGKLTGGIAESWTVSEDGLEWTFNLREAQWSNGTPVSADDFVFAWNLAITNPFNPYAYLFGSQAAGIINAQKILDTVANGRSPGGIELGVSALDRLTLQIELEQPNPALPSLLALCLFSPINEQFYQQSGTSYGLSKETTLSNGPFEIEKWEPEKNLSLVKSPTYWNEQALRIDELIFDFFADRQSALLAYESGQVDFVPIEPEVTEGYEESDDLQEYLNGEVWIISFNTENASLQNENLRKALAYSIDRADLIKEILQNDSENLDGLIPYELSQSYDESDLRTYNDHYLSLDQGENDKAAAKYLEQAKEELGTETIELSLLTSDDKLDTLCCDYLLKAWKELPGLAITLNKQDEQTYQQLKAERNYEIILESLVSVYEDPLDLLEIFYPMESDSSGQLFQVAVQYNDLIEKAHESADPAARYSYMEQAEKLLIENQLVSGLFQRSQSVLQNPDLSGLIALRTQSAYYYKYLILDN